MMGSPTVLSLPRDRLGHPVTLENDADVRRAAAVAVARGRRTDRAAEPNQLGEQAFGTPRASDVRVQITS